MNGRNRGAWFFAGFAAVALVIAGVMSYLADPDPDGLEAVTADVAARNGQPHPLAGTPFADYAVGGDGRFTGVAGVLGVLLTLAVAGGLFLLLRRRSASRR